MISHQRVFGLFCACHLKEGSIIICLDSHTFLLTHNVVRDGLSAADLVRCGCLVSGRHRDSEPVIQGHETARLSQLLGQHGAGLGLHAAVEVAGHVVRHRAVLPAVSLEACLNYESLSLLHFCQKWKRP